MVFWISMVLMDLLIPVMMIGFGRRFMRKPPKEINMVYGYRTTMSMKNKETWEFAHKCCGKIWYICGADLFVLSTFFMLFVIGKSESSIGTLGGILCGVQLAVLFGSIFLTERMLKRNFDKYGNRFNS